MDNTLLSFSLRHLFRSSLYLSVGGVLVAVFGFMQGIIVARTLGPAQYGVLGIVTTFCSMTHAFLSFRTQEPLTRYLVEYKQKQDRSSFQLLIATALITDLITSILTFVVIIILAPWAVQTIDGRQELLYLYWINGAAVLFTCSDAVWYSVSRDRKYFKLLATLPVCFATTKFIGVITIWSLNSLDLMSLSTLYLAFSAFQFLVNMIYLNRELRVAYKISLWGFSWKQCLTRRSELDGFWQFMKITYLSSILSTLVKNGDILALGYYRSDAEVGLYRLAKNMVSLIQGISGSLISVIYQDINELVIAKRINTLKNGLIRISKVWIPSVAIAMVLSTVLSKTLIQLMYGDTFVIASRPFCVLIVGVSISIMFFWISPLMLAMDLVQVQFNVGLINTLWYIPLSIVAIKNFGIMGSALSLSLAWAAGCINLFYIIRKLYDNDKGHS